MYSRPLPKPTPVNENELIDISSDDSNDQSYQHGVKPTNGASTSQKDHDSYGHQHVENYLHNDIARAERVQFENDKAPDKVISSTPFNDRGKKRKLTKEPGPSPMKKKKSAATLHESKVTFKDIGGLDKTLEEVCKLLVHVRHPEVYLQIGISPPRGFLLHGPPGCGKTLLAHAIAGVSGFLLTYIMSWCKNYISSSVKTKNVMSHHRIRKILIKCSNNND